MHQLEKAYAIIQELKKQGKMEEYELFQLEGDYYFNRGNYIRALLCYKHILHTPEAEHNNEIKMDTYYRLIPCYKELGSYMLMNYYADRLLAISKEKQDVKMEATAIFSKGEIQHAYGKKQKAYALMQEAIDKLRQKGLALSYDLGYYFYITMAEYQQKDKLAVQGLHTLDTIMALFGNTVYPNGTGMNVLTVRRLKDIYAHRTVLNYMKGNAEASEMWYQKFCNTGNDSTYNYECIKPYLVEKAHYADIERFAKARKAYLISINDTVSTNYADIYDMLAMACLHKGKYKEAIQYLKRVNEIHRNKSNMERKIVMKELVAIDSLQLQKLHTKRLQVYGTNGIIGVVVLLLVCVGCYFCYTYRMRRIMKKKNAAMAATIDDLLHCKKKYKEQLEATDKEVEENIVHEDKNKELYKKMKAWLSQESVFTRSELNREEILKRFNIPKNTFSSLFIQYEGMTYIQFVATLRLEFAVRMLRRHPEYSIDYIANRSGISVPSFYRLFSQKYGMTPAEYRENTSKDAKDL
ncbi:helix-turn-helix domain-containing protein [Prevotella falsenii]|uniref:helix-turn-helix domain-containing protein n=1 Tax=Prevotella falsenii TaxID=515414 RepID=UPI0018DD5FF2|nr:helix-turn-helix domain-containing protein [Prevotella falsenii]